MEPTAALARRQRTCLQRHRDRCDTGGFLALLGSEELIDTLDTMLPEYRQRLFPPLETLAMFLAQAMSDDGSCQQVLDEFIARRAAADLPVPSASTSAFCQARRRLPTELIAALCRRVGRSLSDTAGCGWRWCGRRAVLIDGTTVSMPDTASNQGVYPQPSSQEPGLGFPQARLVGLSCLSTGALLDLAISPCVGKGSDEPSRQRLLMSDLQAGDVLVGDSNFESYCAMAALQGRGVEAVFEASSGRKLPRRGTLVTLRRPKRRPVWMSPDDFADVPETLRLRRVRVGRRGEKKKTLLTTMIDTRAVSNREIGVLYRRRWGIELDFRSIKQTLGLDVLRCTSAAMVAKEIWAHLLAYNLIRTVMAEAASRHALTPRTIGFKHAMQLWSAWQRHGARLDEEGRRILCGRIAQRRVGNRGGRREPRAIKRRPKPRALLKTPRAQARRECERYERS